MGMSKCDGIVQNFKVTGIPREHFVKSEWENVEAKDKVSIPYLLYRGFFLLYFLLCLPHSIYRTQSRQYWIIMATNWTLLIQKLYAGLFFVNLLLRFIADKREARALKRKNETTKSFDSNPPRNSLPTELNTVDSVVWLLLSVAGTMPHFVSLGYWIFVYPSEPADFKSNIWWALTVHGFNAILALVDILVIAIPVRVAHALYAVGFSLIYALFTCIYEYGGGSYEWEERPYIYPLLNWRENPGWAIGACAGAGLAAFVLHTCLWSLYKIRLFLVSKCRGDSKLHSIAVQDLELSFIWPLNKLS